MTYRLLAGLCALLLVALFLLVAWVRFGPDQDGEESPDVIITGGPETHVVTPQMSATSQTMIDKQAPAFDVADADGRRHNFDELCRKGPVVLIFVKDGCPCSAAAQPLFNAVHASYPGATFLGVINTEADPARHWAEEHLVPYPLVLDPQCRIIRDYNIENSAYVVVIDSQKRILKHWPGYSTTMLRELGLTLAGLTGTTERPLDTTDAPEDLYSGCPFDF